MECLKITCIVSLALVAHNIAASPYVFTGQQIAANPNAIENLGAQFSGLNGFGSPQLDFGFPAYNNYAAGLPPSSPVAASGFEFGVPSDDVFTNGIRQALVQAGFTGSEYPSPLASFNPITGYPVATTLPRYQPVPQPGAGPVAVTSTTEINPTGIDFKALQFIATPPIPKNVPADEGRRVTASQDVRTNTSPQNGRPLDSNGVQSRYPAKDESKFRALHESAAAAASSAAHPKLNDITTQSASSSFPTTQRPSISDLILELKPPAPLSNAQPFEYFGNQNSFSPSSGSSGNTGADNYSSNPALTTSAAASPPPSDPYSGSSYRAADSLSGGSNSAPASPPPYSSVPGVSYAVPDHAHRSPGDGRDPVTGGVPYFNNHYRGSDPARPVAQLQRGSSTPFAASPPNANANNNNYYSNAPNPIAGRGFFDGQPIRGSGQPIAPYGSPVSASAPNSNNYDYRNSVPDPSDRFPGANSPVPGDAFGFSNSVPANGNPNPVRSGAGYYPPYSGPK